MATKTFSGRADADDLEYAEHLAQRDFGLSFGKYCATVLMEAAREADELPRPPEKPGILERRAAAWERMKARSELFRDCGPDDGREVDAPAREERP